MFRPCYENTHADADNAAHAANALLRAAIEAELDSKGFTLLVSNSHVVDSVIPQDHDMPAELDAFAKAVTKNSDKKKQARALGEEILSFANQAMEEVFNAPARAVKKRRAFDLNDAIKLHKELSSRFKEIAGTDFAIRWDDNGATFEKNGVENQDVTEALDNLVAAVVMTRLRANDLMIDNEDRGDAFFPNALKDIDRRENLPQSTFHARLVNGLKRETDEIKAAKIAEEIVSQIVEAANKALGSKRSRADRRPRQQG